MIIVPFGVYKYFKMVSESKNWGIIKVRHMERGIEDDGFKHFEYITFRYAGNLLLVLVVFTVGMYSNMRFNTLFLPDDNQDIVLRVAGISTNEQETNQDTGQEPSNEVQAAEPPMVTKVVVAKPEVKHTVKFTHTAAAGDSLSLIARRSISAYQRERGISLSDGQRMFIENKIISSLGMRRLRVGEVVNVEADLISTYVSLSKNLSQRELDVWARYARGINLEI